MYYTLDNPTTLLAAILLLVLAAFTVWYCQRDKVFTFRKKAKYLFQGKTPIHSFASNLGAVFSATYFGGGIFLLGRLYQARILVVLAFVMVVIVLLHRSIIFRCHERLRPTTKRSLRTNIYLEFLASRLAKRDFFILCEIYLYIYFCLLVVEIAVCRLVVEAILDEKGLMAGFLLATIICTTITYVYLGGFRAVLNSDLVQSPILVLFVLVLIFLFYKSKAQITYGMTLSQFMTDFDSLMLVAVLAVAWFVSAIDFYSRLNFKVRGDACSARQRFATASDIAIGLMIGSGFLFGHTLDKAQLLDGSILNYTAETIRFFLGSSRIVAVTFLVGIYCMMFTTLDTLMITYLQIRPFGKSAFKAKADLPLPVVATVAVMISTFVPRQSVSAVGLFVGSWMLFPFIATLPAFFPQLRFLFPAKLNYLYLAGFIAVVLFGFSYGSYVSDFRSQFAVPAIVLKATLVSALVFKLSELVVSWVRRIR